MVQEIFREFFLFVNLEETLTSGGAKQQWYRNIRHDK